MTDVAYRASKAIRYGAELSAEGDYTDAKHSAVDPSGSRSMRWRTPRASASSKWRPTGPGR